MTKLDTQTLNHSRHRCAELDFLGAWWRRAVDGWLLITGTGSGSKKHGKTFPINDRRFADFFRFDFRFVRLETTQLWFFSILIETTTNFEICWIHLLLPFCLRSLLHAGEDLGAADAVGKQSGGRKRGTNQRLCQTTDVLLLCFKFFNCSRFL